MRRILTINPKIFNATLREKIQEIKRVNEAYILMTNKELGRVLAQFPFIFEIPIEKIKENIIVLRSYNFTSPQIHQIVEILFHFFT